MTTRPTARDKVNEYAAQTDFDRGGLSDREHMAPAAFVALRYVLHACDELDRDDLMAAAVHRIRTAIAMAFDHQPPAVVRDRDGHRHPGREHRRSVPALDFDALVHAVLDSRYQWIRLEDAVDMATSTAWRLAEAGAATITVGGAPMDVRRPVGAMRRLVDERDLLENEAVHDPARPYPYPTALTTSAGVCAVVDALHLIDLHGCTRFTRGRCLDASSGKKRGAKAGADAWCDACVARDALNRMAEESP